ncbi:MAG: hypothetical protein U1D30_19320 [Planctomycetota bacterium]
MLVTLWVREIAGWMLLALGLLLFLYCLSFLGDRRVIEGSVTASIGVVVFRGGIHLVKVATAARVVLRGRKN